MIAQIQVRRGTTAEWAAASPVVLAAGELGYDTTLKRLKVGDGTTEWASLEWIDYSTNPNILHNWDFRNPVNQRGVSGTISATGYFYDRWILNSGTVTVNSGYLTIGAGAEIEQRFDGTGLSGKAVTVSVLLGDAVISGQGTFPTSAGTESVTLTGFGTAALGYHPAGMFVQITATDSTRQLQAIKLELGNVSTLAYDPPMDYGTELAKCQRYFINFGQHPGIYGRTTSATTGDIYIPAPVEMRINPTLNSTGAQVHIAGSAHLPTISSVTSRPNMLRLLVGGVSWGIDISFNGVVLATTALLASADL